MINKNVTNKNHQNRGLSAIFIWLPPSSPPLPQFWWSRPLNRHLFQRFTVEQLRPPVKEVVRWASTQDWRYAVAQRPEPSERHYTWKKTVTTKYRGIQTWDVEDLKGGRKIPEIWGNISVCFKVFVCQICIDLLCQIWPKICSAWSCWTHLIKTKAYCKCFTVSFIEGVNMYVYIYIHI